MLRLRPLQAFGGKKKGILNFMRAAHGDRVGNDGHGAVKEQDRDFKCGVAFFIQGEVLNAFNLHIVIVFAAPDDLCRAVPVANMQTGRGCNFSFSAAAAEGYLHGIFAVSKVQGLRGGKHVSGKGRNRQRVRPEDQGSVVPELLVFAEGSTGDARIQRRNRKVKKTGSGFILLHGDVEGMVGRGSFLCGAGIQESEGRAAHIEAC